jgi:quinolinate synthase
MQDIVSEIQELKKTKKATILAHYYQEGEIQEIADFNGDSLALARAATKVETPIIVFCGVHFMAETAKILNPAKKVLLPDLQAGCSLADSCPADKLNRYQQMLRENGRDFQTVTYINSTADVKALSDWVVTSGNAREIIERVPKDKEILFVPDKHLGQYLEEVCNRKMILWDGACMVHEIFSLGDLLAMKKKVPTSLVFAHPECPANIRANSDFVGGTEAMLKKLASLKNDTDIIVATEPNMMWQMQHRFPMHRYHPVPGITCACNKCPHMARNTLEKIKDCLVNESPEIIWKSTFDKAKVVLERSLLN